MAQQWSYGFDNNNTGTDIAQIASMNTLTNNSINLVTGRFGGKALQVRVTNSSYYNAYVTRAHSASVAAGCVGTAILNDGNFNPTWVGFMDSGILQCYCNLNDATGVVTINNGSGTLLGTATITGWVTKIWHYLEFAATIHPTAGTAQCWVDGVSVLSLTGVNTRNSANSTFNQVKWNFQLNTGSVQNMAIDDIYFKDDLTPNGPQQVITLEAVSAFGTSGFTPLSSTNVSQINETAMDGDTTYNASLTVAASDVFNFGTLAATVVNITAVNLVMESRKDAAGSRQTSTLINSSGTIAGGTNLNPASSYIVTSDQFLVDPATGAAWTTAAINAAKAGYRIVS